MEHPNPTPDDRPVEIDWELADIVAAALGRATRELVARRDADAVQEWGRRMGRTAIGEFNAPRAASYIELAVLAGHRSLERADHVGREWVELAVLAETLAHETKTLAAAVRLKTQQEQAAATAADEDDEETS